MAGVGALRLAVVVVFLTWGASHAAASDAEIEALVKTLRTKNAPPAERRAALMVLGDQWKSRTLGKETRLKVLKGVLRTLPDAPAPLKVAILDFLRTQVRDPRLARVVIHLVDAPGEEQKLVRAAALATIDSLVGLAALPTLLHCADDEDPEVARAVDRALERHCWPVRRRMDESRKERWLRLFRTEAGGKMLAAAFVKLNAIHAPEGLQPSSPIAMHVVPLLLDEHLPFGAWREGVRFLARQAGVSFLPETAGAREMTEADRATVVAAIRAWSEKTGG